MTLPLRVLSLSVSVAVSSFIQNTPQHTPQYSVVTSCTGRGSVAWEAEDVRAAVASWLGSLVTVQGRRGDLVQSRLWDSTDRLYYRHTVGYYDTAMKNADTVDRSVITVGQFDSNFRPQGLTWQLVSRYRIDGMLYGEVFLADGTFTGDNITFIYPDYVTGLHGTFVNGSLVEGEEVKISGYRCRDDGFLELQITHINTGVRWMGEKLTSQFVGSNPTRVEPHEKRSVYVGQSTIPQADEGLFARRDFLAGDLVTYFSGVVTTESEFLFDNMTAEEYDSAAAYYFGLGENVPRAWKIPESSVLDIPSELRSIVQFRTTLGHKLNHQFENTNVEFSVVLHPMFGPIACAVATQVILAGEELFVNYNYDLESTFDWYKELYRATYPEYDKNTKTNQ